MNDSVFLKTPKNFDFKRTIFSHGWYQLLPFEFDSETEILKTTIRLKNPVSIEIYETNAGLEIKTDSNLNEAAENEITAKVRHIFRLDEKFHDLYKLIKPETNLKWIARQKEGRLLRSATVFEDLVKTICTTNCSWALTKKMVANLVEKLGEVSANGKKAFPTPEAMAKMPVEFYREEIKSGYRAPYFKELADKINLENLNVEEWLNDKLPVNDLKKEIKKIKGVGNYAAENLLKLLGHYNGLALDSWLRAQFYKKHNGTKICDDKIIENYYARFGKWRGIVIWCDMSRD